MNGNDVTKRIEKAFAEWDKPVDLPKPSGKWVGCREARELIWTANNDRSPGYAERAIARRAHVIPSQIVSWAYSWEPQEGISRYELAQEEQDLSDWTATPSRLAVSRRYEVLSYIGDNPADFLIIGSGLRDACWITGDFSIVLDGDFRRETITLIGLSFDPEALLLALNLPNETDRNFPPVEHNAIGSFPNARTKDRNVGGRPASRHGEVIASATLRLSQLPSAALRTYTAESLASELENEYQRLGEAPPNHRSRTLYASGILRVIRAHQT